MRRAIIVAVNTLESLEKINYQLEELKNLALACDIEIIDNIIQKLPDKHPNTYVGKGKLLQLQEAVVFHEVDLIVINDELTPNQINNLSKYLKIDIYDRTFLILEIFQKRAKTKEALLQVEAALLKYMLPRLAGLHKGLSRQRGTTAQGVARGRGAGETQLELDRRYIKNQIQTVQKELAKLMKRRQQQRNKRKKTEIKTVGLVGYTNSGKSTLLNALLKYTVERKKTVFQKDILFATLETATRLIRTENNVKFLVTDTVGFVDNLPPHLIEAFKSTLEEISEADLVVHVVDAANPNFEKQIDTTNHVLSELGVKSKPIIYVFNKIDLMEGDFVIPEYCDKAIKISAEKIINIEKFLTLIEEELFNDYRTIKINVPLYKSDLIASIKSEAIIINEKVTKEGLLIEAKIPEKLYREIQNI
ncbi:MAG: GTPase HflX [Bacilli bacterium]|nr:GTPase HflX [Bacilli bacterium]MDD4077248.1 GTPase HflX [Bacilli bacterium]MDD4388051.1 GTPase HflX [Bacilli bacterium]